MLKFIKKSVPFILIIMIAGCTHMQSKDGPPGYNVDVNRIPDAVPRVEPISKSGNMKSYHVFGKQYHVMASSKGYEERGIASWYGRKFHGASTSDGETYNMLAMTAAHKSLPLPTYVQVTNLSNGKKVIVKVNDRGPFAENRIIDLSYVAAKKLGMLGHGTAYVDVKAIDPNEATTPVALAHMHVYLQVGAFKNRVNAEQLRQHLMTLTSSEVRINATHKLYQVQVGPFQDLASANRFNARLKSQGISGKKIL